MNRFRVDDVMKKLEKALLSPAPSRKLRQLLYVIRVKHCQRGESFSHRRKVARKRRGASRDEIDAREKRNEKATAKETRLIR